MRLADFIERHSEAILAQWQAFAGSLGEASNAMADEALRDNAASMLFVIVRDLRHAQSPSAQEAKGKGHASSVPPSTAASQHGVGRQHDGFSLPQVAAEFRALRASVLRLWLPTVAHPDAAALEEMTRFNEAVDQAIAESIATYSQHATRARDVFLAMLGHDLRSPLHVIGLSTDYLDREVVDTPRRIASAKRIKRSLSSMSAMVDDLLDFSRLQLGGSIPIVLQPDDLATICRRAIDDAQSAHPSCTFVINGPPSLPGLFDTARLLQVIGNLLNNASQYRTRETVVTLRVERRPEGVAVDVHNFGLAIDPASFGAIFDPLIQLAVTGDDGDRPRSSAGLGLYIARRIVEAHGGTIRVDSSADLGTTFSVRLPTHESSTGHA